MYCVSGSDAHAMKINADGTLSAPFSTADTASGSAYLDISKDGK